MTPKKFSLIPRQHQPLLHFDGYCPAGDNGVMIQSAVNAPAEGRKAIRWLMSPTLCTSALTPRRYATPADLRQYRRHLSQHRKRRSAGDAFKTGRLLPEKPRRKTEALIFGSHDSSTLEMTQKMSDYLDILWARRPFRGRCTISTASDNSLILGLHSAVEGPLFELQRVNDQQRRGVAARGNAAAG